MVFYKCWTLRQSYDFGWRPRKSMAWLSRLTLLCLWHFLIFKKVWANYVCLIITEHVKFASGRSPHMFSIYVWIMSAIALLLNSNFIFTSYLHFAFKHCLLHITVWVWRSLFSSQNILYEIVPGLILDFLRICHITLIVPIYTVEYCSNNRHV